MRILPTLSALVLIGSMAGCFQPLRPSEVHLRPDPAPAPSAAPIPAPVPMTATLPKPRAAFKPETYSVVVNQVPVQQLLFALARDAKLNIDVHPGITGAVTLNAIDQTLPQLLSRIGKQVDMRWELDGPNLAVMPDSPYLRLYKIDYVNMERITTGTVSVSAQIATTGGGGGGGGGGAGGAGSVAGAAGGNASTVVVRNTSSNKFWDTLVKNVEELLRETDKIIPTGNTQQSNPQAQPAAAAANAANPGAPPAPIPTTQFREAASVIANPEAGLINVRATARQHERIQEFLDQVTVSSKRQVLIEGTIVEVSLSNQYQQGVDWSKLSGLGGWRFQTGLAQTTVGSLTASPTGSIGTLGYTSRDFSGVLRLLESFGTVRVLSSPRLSVMNNQTALLKVVDNLVYFTITANTSSNQTSSNTTFTTTPNVVPIGFVMNVTPFIGDSDSVTLNLKPTISRVVSFVEDPNPVLRNPCLAASQSSLVGRPNDCNIPAIISRIPQVQTRELESMIRVQNGQIAVMGGLIQDRTTDNEDSIPGLNRVPIVRHAFENRSRASEKTELVIFLRPVVVRDPSLEGDYRGYRVMLPGEDFMTRRNPERRDIGVKEIER